jgi:hypothetical protein
MLYALFQCDINYFLGLDTFCSRCTVHLQLLHESISPFLCCCKKKMWTNQIASYRSLGSRADLAVGREGLEPLLPPATPWEPLRSPF